MALSRGFAAIKKAKKEAERADKQRAASRTRDFYLKGDGDSAIGWFNGPSDEPAIVMVHSMTIDGKFDTGLCASGHEDHAGCVYCFANGRGDKRVLKPKPTAAMNFYDMRWMHKRLNKEKTAAAGGKFEKFDWFDCKGDSDNEEPDKADKRACKKCRKGVPRVRSGQKKTRFSMTAAGALDGQNDSAKKKCHCGGKLSLEGYQKGKKVVEDLDDVSDPDNWEPMYECRKCDDPAPRSIHSCPVEITRSGTGVTTQYNFTPKWDELGDPPEYVSASEPIDLEAAHIPESADEMAAKLGMQNPFAKGDKKKSKAVDYDEDEDDEDAYAEDDDDDDDDD